MMLWIFAGLLTALALAIIIAPLVRNHKGLALALTILVPLLALALYLWGGNPELAR